jgi:outer membrane receptor protein involved in Fe transport
VHQSSIGVFAENTVHWFPWLKTITGVRADGFLFDVNADRPGNSGGEMAGIISPKFTAVFGPWDKTEYYVNFGTGFHSNDARGVNTTITIDPNNVPISTLPVPGLVRTVGGELGVRTQLIPKTTAILSLWYLQSESELVYVGDEGTNDPGPASRRFGVEAATYWNPLDWLGVDAEIAVSHGRLKDNPDGKFIPNSIPWMFSGGFVLGAKGQQTGWFAGSRARMFGKRTLREDGSVRGRQTVMVNANVGYRTPRWEGVLECLNMLNRRDRDIEYFYESRMRNENNAASGIHFHPVEPRMFRARVTYKF